MHAGSNPVAQTHKVCCACKINKLLDEFSKKSTAKDGLQSRCKVCQRLKVNEHYANNMQYYKDKAFKRDTKVIAYHRSFLITYLRNHPCIDCGNSDVEVLQFDHIDRTTKLNEVSNLLSGSTQKLLDEIAKCQIRCANCHIKRSRRQLGWWLDE
jgi:hypothetical protein